MAPVCRRQSVDARARVWSSVGAALAMCPNSLRRRYLIIEETGAWFLSLLSLRCASSCVVECQICNQEVAGSNQPGLLCTKVYSALHPSGVSKWVPAAAGKAKAGMAHSDCGWTCGCAGKTEIPWELCHTWALLQCWFTTKRHYIKCMNLYLTFTFLVGLVSSRICWRDVLYVGHEGCGLTPLIEGVEVLSHRFCLIPFVWTM